MSNTEEGGGGRSSPLIQPSYDTPDLVQALLELLWMVYSEGKLQSCLKLRNFQNPFNKDKSVGL